MTRIGNAGVEKISRMARRYATTATARGMKNDSSPTRLKLREQIVSATSKMEPSPKSLCEGVRFTRLPFNGDGGRLLAPLRRISLQSVRPLQQRVAIPARAVVS